ncbi:MAG: heme-copper oxidase subunit III [Bacteroidia bacterium]
MEIQEEKERAARSKRIMMWLGVISIVMMFAGLTSGYVVLQADNYWVKFELPNGFWISTVLIVASSVTMFLAMRAVRSNNLNAVKYYLLITLGLGLGFMGSQSKAWSQLIHQGNFFVGKISDLKGEYGKDYVIMNQGAQLNYIDGNFYAASDKSLAEPLNEKINHKFNTASGYLYVLTALHFIHVFVGIIVLLVVLFNAYSNKYSSENPVGMELASIYWHFLDGLWVYLFFFLLFIR